MKPFNTFVQAAEGIPGICWDYKREDINGKPGRNSHDTMRNAKVYMYTGTVIISNHTGTTALEDKYDTEMGLSELSSKKTPEGVFSVTVKGWERHPKGVYQSTLTATCLADNPHKVDLEKVHEVLTRLW